MIAICASGPSLARTWPAHNRAWFTAVLAINAAAEVVHPDWCVFGDIEALDQYRVLPSAGYCAPLAWGKRASRGDLGSRFTAHRWSFWEDHLPDIARRRCDFSFVAALYFARARWPGHEVHVFGNDQTADPDCIGDTASNRTPARWAKEAEQVSHALAVTGLQPIYHR